MAINHFEKLNICAKTKSLYGRRFVLFLKLANISLQVLEQLRVLEGNFVRVLVRVCVDRRE